MFKFAILLATYTINSQIIRVPLKSKHVVHKKDLDIKKKSKKISFAPSSTVYIFLNKIQKFVKN